MAASGEFWSVLVTKPNHEKFACENLLRNNFVSYFPKIKYKRFVGKKRKIFVRPLFPNYLFLKVDGPWRGVFGTPGVSRILLDAGVPAKVPVGFVESMKSRERNGYIEDTRRKPFSFGQKLEVTYGLMKGRKVIHQRYTANERIEVLVQLLGRFSRVQIDQAAVTPAL